MYRQSSKPRGPFPVPGTLAAAAPERGAAYELKLRPSGRWGVFCGGKYVASTGTSDHRLARLRLRMHENRAY